MIYPIAATTMSKAMAVSKQTRRIVGFVALVATILIMGGIMTLAEHYSHTGQDCSDQRAGNTVTQKNNFTKTSV